MSWVVDSGLECHNGLECATQHAATMIFRPTPNVTSPQVDDETAPEYIWMDDATAWMDDDDLRHKYRVSSISTAPRG